MMTLTEIKESVKIGRNVYWGSLLYQVVFIESKNDFYIKCTTTNGLIGLTYEDGKTMNGKPEDFFIEDINILSNPN